MGGGGKGGGGNSYQMDKEAVKEQTAANRVNQTTPWGSSKFTQSLNPDGSTQWSQDTTVDPMLQQALNAQFQTTANKSNLANSMFGRVQQDMDTPMSWDNLPGFGWENSGTLERYAVSPTGQQTSLDTSQLDPYQRQVDPTTGSNMATLGVTGQQNQIDMTGMPNRANADTAERQRIEGALFDRMRPEHEQQTSGMETKLRNQGITEGSGAWKRAMQGVNDAQSRERFNALAQGGQEMSNLFGMQSKARSDAFGEQTGLGNFANQSLNNLFQQRQGAQAGNLGAQNQGFNQRLAAGNFANAGRANQFNELLQSGQFGNQALNNIFNQQNTASGTNFGQGQSAANFQMNARQQQLAERQAQKMQNLNFLNAIMGGTQVQTPQFANYSQADRANAGLNVQDNAQKGDILGDISKLAGTGASMFAMSDIRLKSNIKRIGTHPLGIGIYEYDIGGRRDRGVMAQEVLDVMPAAVYQHASGYLMVNHAQLGN